MVLNLADAIVTTVSGQFQNKLKRRLQIKVFTFQMATSYFVNKTAKTQFNSFLIVFTGLLTVIKLYRIN